MVKFSRIIPYSIYSNIFLQKPMKFYLFHTKSEVISLSKKPSELDSLNSLNILPETFTLKTQLNVPIVSFNISLNNSFKLSKVLTHSSYSLATNRSSYFVATITKYATTFHSIPRVFIS